MNRYAPFYASFGLSCAKSIDATSDICYCLKRQNNAYFDAAILRGNLELGDTVLILPLPLPLRLRLPLTLTLTPTLTLTLTQAPALEGLRPVWEQ